MATGVQAAALCKSKEGQFTAPDMCVHGIVYEVLDPLGVPCPQTSYIPTFLSSNLIQEVSEPFVGCIARWPQSKGYQHVSMITGMSGDTLTETSFGTGSGIVRSYNYPKSFFESFWTPQYDGQLTGGNVSQPADETASLGSSLGTAAANAAVPGLGTFLNDLSNTALWIRIGLGVLGAGLLGIALLKILASTDAGSKLINTSETAAKVAAVVA